MLMTPDEVTWNTSLAIGESTISSPSRPLNSWWPKSNCTYLLGIGFNERPTATPSITKQRMPSSLGLSSIGNGMTGPADEASIGFIMAPQQCQSAWCSCPGTLPDKVVLCNAAPSPE